MAKNVNSTTFVYEDLLKKILINFKGFILPRLSGCCNEIDGALFDLADKAVSNQLQSSYFESMKMIRNNKKQFLIDFENSLIKVFDSFKKGQFNYFKSQSSMAQDNQSSELELIEDLKLDESLAQLNIVQKSEAAYHKHLYAFEKRFSLLMDNQMLNLSQLPISPFVIVSLFSKTIRPLDVDIEVVKLMYTFFERFVMGQLNDIYSQINDIFISNGIIRNLKYDLGKIRNQQKSQEKQHKQELTNVFKGEEDSSSVAFSQESLQDYIDKSTDHQNLDQNYQLITKMLQLNHKAIEQTHSNSNLVQVKCVDVQLMISALSLLQDNLFNSSTHIKQADKSPIALKQTLYSKLSEIDTNDNEMRVNQRDEDIIDLVSLLFQFLVDDRNLPDPIHRILVKLQFPYLKIALQDRNLFADKNHDARILLDKMTKASIGWTEESDYRQKFITKIKEITNHLMNAKTYNNKIFEILILNFDDFLSRFNKKVQINLKRTKERIHGQEKVESAKQDVAQILFDKMNNKHIPEFIRTLLLSDWSDVLVLMHLSSVYQESEINNKIDFIDNVINFSQSNFDSSEADANILLKIYECGLKHISYHPLELEKKVNSLKAFLEQFYEQASVEDKQTDSTKVTNNLFSLSEYRNKKFEILNYIKEVVKKDSVGSFMNSRRDEYYKILNSIDEGNWLEFEVNSKESYRGQFAGISKISGKVLFVNLRGLKLFEKDLEVVANGILSNQIRIIKAEGLFDRALSRIAYDLTNMPNN